MRAPIGSAVSVAEAKIMWLCHVGNVTITVPAEQGQVLGPPPRTFRQSKITTIESLIADSKMRTKFSMQGMVFYAEQLKISQRSVLPDPLKDARLLCLQNYPLHPP